MIVKMKKVFILVKDDEKQVALEIMRNLGTIHIKKQVATSHNLARLMERNNLLTSALRILSASLPKKGIIPEKINYYNDVGSYIIELHDSRKLLFEEITQLKREVENLKKWGDFNPLDFEFLTEHGIIFHYYELIHNVYENNIGEIPVIILAKNKKTKIVKLLSLQEIPGCLPIPLPQKSLVEITNSIEQKNAQWVKMEKEIQGLSHYKEKLETEINLLQKEIEFETVKVSMVNIEDTLNEQKDGINQIPLSWVSGYIPSSEIDQMKNTALENSWAISIDEPDKDDAEVPTLLKNNKLGSLIYPLTDFLEMSPGYHETDISTLFMLFVTLFFALIFGDAGYGIIIVGISLLGILLTCKNSVPAIFKFLLLTGSATVVWGSLTCSWFGVNIDSLPNFLQKISLPLVTGPSISEGWVEFYNAQNYWIFSGLIKPYESYEKFSLANVDNLIWFSFIIAFIHLAVAQIKCLIQNIKTCKVLGDIGSLAMLLGMYYLTLALVVHKTGFDGVKDWQLYSILLGFVMFFLFANYEGSVLKSIKVSLENIISVLIGVVNIFSNIMSYIRLWAVAVAGGALAGTVNNIANPMFAKFSLIIFGIILVIFGHVFNMTLNVLGVLVHGVRLNTLEFSGVIGLNWSGFKYKPFKK